MTRFLVLHKFGTTEEFLINADRILYAEEFSDEVEYEDGSSEEQAGSELYFDDGDGNNSERVDETPTEIGKLLSAVFAVQENETETTVGGTINANPRTEETIQYGQILTSEPNYDHHK